MAEVRFTPVHVAFANPFGFSVANTVFTQLTVDVTTKDGITAHADLVNVSQVRGGKIVAARDYFFDPSVEEAVWGRVADPSGRALTGEHRGADQPRTVTGSAPGAASPEDGTRTGRWLAPLARSLTGAYGAPSGRLLTRGL
jgi:hypothetical protein